MDAWRRARGVGWKMRKGPEVCVSECVCMRARSKRPHARAPGQELTKKKFSRESPHWKGNRSRLPALRCTHASHERTKEYARLEHFSRFNGKRAVLKGVLHGCSVSWDPDSACKRRCRIIYHISVGLDLSYTSIIKSKNIAGSHASCIGYWRGNFKRFSVARNRAQIMLPPPATLAGCLGLNCLGAHCPH